MKEKFKALLDNIYLISGGLFFLLSIFSYFTIKSIPALVAGVTTSLIIIIFHYIFKPKWSPEAKKALEDSLESIKPFGANLPLQIIGKLQLVFVILMIVCLVRNVLAVLIPGFPTFILLILSNICYSLFILGSFYNLFQGNVKTFTLTTKLFALYQVLEVLITFFTEKGTISVKGMCLFLAFYSLSYIFEYMLSDSDPEEGKPKKEKQVKEKKEKKEKKLKKKKGAKEAEETESSEEVVEASETPTEES